MGIGVWLICCVFDWWVVYAVCGWLRLGVVSLACVFASFIGLLAWVCCSMICSDIGLFGWFVRLYIVLFLD